MQRTVPFSYYRGGTSKAVFSHEDDLPLPGKERDRLILRLMGSLDPTQIDGMGGTHPVTSKVAIVKKSETYISYDGGCGNISAAVAPFAINEGLIKTEGCKQEVSIWMVRTQTRLVAHVPINPKTKRPKDQKKMATTKLMDVQELTAGGAIKKGLLPTSNVIDNIEVRGRELPLTICDIAHIIVFGKAEDFGIAGSESSAELNANDDLISRIREFRGKAAHLVGICSDWRKVDEEAPNLPYVVLVSTTDDADVQSRLFLDNHCHTSMAGAGAACTAACSRISGSLVHAVANSQAKSSTFRIKHPIGYIPVEVKADSGSELPRFETLSFVRTARCIAKGELFVPEDLDDQPPITTNGDHS